MFTKTESFANFIVEKNSDRLIFYFENLLFSTNQKTMFKIILNQDRCISAYKAFLNKSKKIDYEAIFTALFLCIDLKGDRGWLVDGRIDVIVHNSLDDKNIEEYIKNKGDYTKSQNNFKIFKSKLSEQIAINLDMFLSSID